MYRLFVAIRPPRDIRERLLALETGARGARWQSDDQLHLTLRFIGEVDRHCAEDVAAALGGVRFPRFAIALAGLGSFDNAIWAGVTPHDRLAALHRKIDQACVRAGLEPERRAYLPHITLARLRRGAGPVDDIVGGGSGLTSGPFTVDSFDLYESDLTSEGAIYSTVERYPLD